MAFTMHDGTEPPKIEKLTHADSFYKTSLDQRIDVRIDEYVHTTIRVFFASGTEGWEQHITDCMMRVVGKRIEEGWELVSADRFYASMRKAR